MVYRAAGTYRIEGCRLRAYHRPIYFRDWDLGSGFILRLGLWRLELRDVEDSIVSCSQLGLAARPFVGSTFGLRVMQSHSKLKKYPPVLFRNDWGSRKGSYLADMLLP